VREKTPRAEDKKGGEQTYVSWVGQNAWLTLQLISHIRGQGKGHGGGKNGKIVGNKIGPGQRACHFPGEARLRKWNRVTEGGARLKGGTREDFMVSTKAKEKKNRTKPIKNVKTHNRSRKKTGQA